MQNRIRIEKATLIWRIGLVLGIGSMFFHWAVLDYGRGASLATFISSPSNTIFSVFANEWPWPLGLYASYLFLVGCLAQLFTKWGVIAQVGGLLLFVPFLITVPSALPIAIGPGFVLGWISVACIAYGRYAERTKVLVSSTH